MKLKIYWCLEFKESDKEEFEGSMSHTTLNLTKDFQITYLFHHFEALVFENKHNKLVIPIDTFYKFEIINKKIIKTFQCKTYETRNQKFKKENDVIDEMLKYLYDIQKNFLDFGLINSLNLEN